MELPPYTCTKKMISSALKGNCHRLVLPYMHTPLTSSFIYIIIYIYIVFKVQGQNLFPPLMVGIKVTVMCITSDAGAKYNDCTGMVVEATAAAGRAGVLLDGKAKPISFKLMNLVVD